MRRLELEGLVLAISDRVKAGQPLEDSRVELKAAWPADPQKAARRLGGHANASRGEPALWIVGLDEKAGVVGADFNELSNWWRSVESNFDGVAPSLLLSLNVPVDGKIVAALLFETDRSPYVVKTGLTGGVTLEVPWRSGTGIGSARRDELLRILYPAMKLPDVDLLDAVIRIVPDASNSRLYVETELQVTPSSRDGTVLPAHRCALKFKTAGGGAWIDAAPVVIRPAAGTSPNLVWSGREGVFTGAAVAAIQGIYYHIGTPPLNNELPAQLQITIGVAGTDRLICIERSLTPLRQQEAGEWCRWVL